jgi:hypothetical protein
MRTSLPTLTSQFLAVGAGLVCLFGVAGCALLPGAAGDGYASAQVHTWQDVDGDGQQDPDEDPLAWVTIRMDYARSITDANGQGMVGVLKPGCARRCWEDEMVSIQVPPGQQATTPTDLALTDQEGSYGFGFQQEAGAPSLSFPGEPDWFHAFSNRGLDLTAFHYAGDAQRLTLTLHAPNSAVHEALYADIFDVALTLRKSGGVALESVEITGLPAGEVTACQISTLEEWSGKLSAAEIVARYCQRAR